VLDPWPLRFPDFRLGSDPAVLGIETLPFSPRPPRSQLGSVDVSAAPTARMYPARRAAASDEANRNTKSLVALALRGAGDASVGPRWRACLRPLSPLHLLENRG
jgi:hypothetical protein